MSAQKLSTQKRTIKTSSPEKSSTQKPTTEGMPAENFPTESHSSQKSSPAKGMNTSQKGTNKSSPSLLSSAQELSPKQELSPEQKSSPEKLSTEKVSTQNPTTEGKATENFPTESHSSQKSSPAKGMNTSQKGANKTSPSLLSPTEDLSSQQESSPEQKPSSKEHLLSRETVSSESASPSPASCTSSQTTSAGDGVPTLENKKVGNAKEEAKEKESVSSQKATPTQEKASPTQIEASTDKISSLEEVSRERQSSPGKHLLTSTNRPSEDVSAPVEPLSPALTISDNEEKKTSSEEKTLEETTVGEKGPEVTAAEGLASKKISEEKTPLHENSSFEVLPTSLGANSSEDEVRLLPPPLFKEEHTAGAGLPTSSEGTKLPFSPTLFSSSLEEPSRAGEQEKVCVAQNKKKEKPSSVASIVSDKNVRKKKFICPQDVELQFPSKPLLLGAPASVPIAEHKCAHDTQEAEKDSDSDKISLEEGLAQLFSMDVKDFFSEDSEADADLSRAAKQRSGAPAVAKAIKEFIPDPNNPLVAKGAQFIYSVSDEEILDDSEPCSNRSAKATSSKIQAGSSSGPNKLPEGACKVERPSAKTSVDPTLGDQCVITRTHMFGSSSAGREYQSGILTIRADVAKLTNPETKEPAKQHTGKKTRAQKIKEAQLATIRGQAKKEVRGKSQKSGRKHGKKSEPPAPLPSKISHLGVSLFVSRFGLKK